MVHDMKNNKSSKTSTEVCRLFSLSEIILATQDFNEDFIIGKGGFGNVYKGFINDGIVAIKRLCSTSKQGEVEFRMEIETLSKLRHIHLVSLIGYCNESEEMILVYEYMPNRTIVDHLYKLDHNQSPLSWEKRLKICIGAARGLDYLHTGTVPGIIHRDVKDSNILLDDQFVAKISDFGLAKLENINLSQSYVSTNVKGTFGFLDPEYFLTRRLSKKTDVYAFGVVLLVVLCGRSAVDMSVREDQQSLTLWALESIRSGKVIQILDPNVEGQVAVKSLEAFLKVAIKCLDKKPKRRPNMSHIVASLEFALEQQLLSPPISAAEKVGLGSLIQLYLQQGNEKENDTVSIATARWNVSPSDRVTRNGILVDKVRLNHKVKVRTRLGNARAESWLRGFFLKGKAAIVNPQNSYDESFSSESDGAKLAPAEGCIYSGPTSRFFSLSQLKRATNNFSSDTLLHEGSLGKVYKGWLQETGLVAIKRCNPEYTTQGHEEWKAEINIQGTLSHPNVTKLLGYFHHDKELILVYEYISKGVLNNHLFCRGNSTIQPLPWDIRVNILTGAARALVFLHSSDTNIIFRDVNTSSILLDESYNTKLSGFGLARLGPSADESHVMTRVMGTFGYIDPEYFKTGQFNSKCDVYGFGVVMVEMLTGLRALDSRRPKGQENMIHWIKPRLSMIENLELVMDSKLNGRYSLEEASIVAQTALTCLEDEPKMRPSMKEVLEILEGLPLSTVSPR